MIISLLSLTACGTQATTSEPEPQTEQISTEAVTPETEKETETSLLEEETTETEIETEATKADEQLPAEKVADYTVTPMTATMYAQQAVNLRQGPGTNYDKTGSLSTNQSVEVTGYTDVASGKWYQLSNGSFVSSKYLSTDKVVIKTPTNNNSSNSSNNSTNNSSNSGGSNQSSSSSEGQTVTGIGATGDGSGSSRANRSAGSDGTGGSDSLAGMGNLQ